MLNTVLPGHRIVTTTFKVMEDLKEKYVSATLPLLHAGSGYKATKLLHRLLNMAM